MEPNNDDLRWEEDGLITNYCKKFIGKNLWKVQNLGYEWEDLYHECWIIFDECKKSYPNIESKQFMAVFKQALIYNINTLAVKDTKERELKEKILLVVNRHEGIEEEREDIVRIAESNITISEAPEIIKKTLNFLENTPKEYEGKIGVRGVSNKMLCSYLGLPAHKFNIFSYVQEYFK